MALGAGKKIAMAHLKALRADTSGIKPLRQIVREMRSMRQLYGSFPTHYIRLALYHRSVETAANFFPPAEASRRRSKMQPPEMQKILRDKRRLSRMLSQAGVSVAQLLFTVNEGQIFQGDTEITAQTAAGLIEDAPFEVMSKLADSSGGRGITVVSDAAKAVAYAVESKQAYLFEERLIPHPDMAPLSSGAINSVRIDTTMTPNGWGHSSSLLRLGADGSVVDNGAAGGKIVPLDLATGRVRVGYLEGPSGRLPIGTHHPVTGQPLVGYQLPDWDQLKAIACQAADVVKDAQTIGWDMALTDRGPVVIEGNAGWALTGLSIAAVDGLLSTPVGRLLFPEIPVPVPAGP